MKALFPMAAFVVLAVPVGGFASGDFEAAGIEVAAVQPARAAGIAWSPLPALGVADGASAASAHPASALAKSAVLPVFSAAALANLEAAARAGDLNAAVELGLRHEAGEGVPKDLQKSSTLYCRAAKYGHPQALFNLGRAYSEGVGVTRDERVAAALFRRAADRGHAQASHRLAAHAHNANARMPSCLTPAPLPVAALPRALPGADRREPQLPAAPTEIMQLVQKLAPLYAIDSNLVLAVIWAESSFDPNAVSTAKARGLMQLIPETAERFGVRNAFSMDENIKGGLAYLRWLLAYFRGDVALALAGYNAGEGNVDKHGGIPPFAETREYVQKIIGVYRNLVHPYNPGVVGPSPLISQAKRTM